VSDSPGERRDAPDLAEALKDLGASGRAGLSAAGDAAKALRILIAADISLARSALGRTLALTGVAIAFGASAWLLLMATLIVALSRGLGWPWPLSLLLTAVLSVAITLYAGWRAMRYFEHTRLKATRRQFARLGLGELADLMPDADSPDSTAQAAERVAAATADAPIKKGLGVDVTPP
jgi:membrane protein implicated in regulation of membrane protease activity